MPTHTTRDRVAARTRQGWSAPQIANELGITTRSVQRARTKLGVAKRPPRRLSSDERQTIGDMLRDGASYPEVGRTVGRHPSVIRRAFPGYTFTTEQMAAARANGRAMARIERNTNPLRGTPAR